MLVVYKHRPEIDIKDAVGTYEFSVVLSSNVCSRRSNASLLSEECPDILAGESTAVPHQSNK